MIRLLFVSGFTTVIALAFLPSSARGAFNVDDASLGQVETVAFDTHTAGNFATSVGSVQSARTRHVGSSFPVDIVIDEVHGADKLYAFGMEVRYDPTVLSVTARDFNFLFASPPNLPFFLTDTPPDTDGAFRLDVAELDDSWSYGEGVLARLTFTCLQAGVSELVMFDDVYSNAGEDPGIIDQNTNTLLVANSLPATITCSHMPVGGPVELRVTSSQSESDVRYVVPILVVALLGAAGTRRLIGRKTP
jgi:hypothetical protein